MRIAYLGYDQSCLKSLSYLSSKEHEVVYFLKEKTQNHHFLNFDKANIFSQKLMIPYDVRERTSTHQKEFSRIVTNYNLLKKSIASDLPVSQAGSANNAGNIANVFELATVIDIQFDANQKKIIIELEKKGVEVFDLLVTESHPLLTDFFTHKKIQVFKTAAKADYTWTSVSFEIEYLKPVTEFSKAPPFFAVLDSARKTIIDNWLYCELSDQKINIWNFQPTNQLHNPQFQDFYIDRLRQSVTQILPFLHLKNYESTHFSSAAHLSYEPRLKLNSSLIVPNFDFWSENQVTEFLGKHMHQIFKKLKKHPEASL